MARNADPAVQKRWRTLLRKQSQSGLTIAEFCRRHGCSPASFYLWRRRFAEQPEPTPPAAFLPVSLNGSRRQQAHFRICLASGAVIEIPEQQVDTLFQLVDHLDRQAEVMPR